MHYATEADDQWLPKTKQCSSARKSLMAKWLERASQGHQMYSHDLEVMSSNPIQVELGVRSTSD